MQPVLVGYDGTDTSRQALSRGAELAAGLQADLHVVTVVTETVAEATDGGPIVMAVDAAETLLVEAEKELQSTYGDHVNVTTTAIPSVSAGDALLRYAVTTDAQLLVVGNLRVRGFRRLLGSVPDDVASHAPCDVLIVKTT